MAATNSTIATERTQITEAYLSSERTESLPLKKVIPREPCVGSLRVIVICFFVLTLIITIALAAQIRMGDFQLVPHGSVATDSPACSNIGINIMKQGGNSVDAAVASTLCMGVVNPHITGIGGGGFIIIYDHRKRVVLDSIDFREVSPQIVGSGASEAGLDVGVPGIVKGLALAQELHGLLSWADVVMPAVLLARNGFPVPESLISARLKLSKTDGLGKEKLRQFVEPLETGQTLRSPRLAATLELIATKGPEVLYNGSLADQILSAVQLAQGFMTQRDLSNYTPMRSRALVATFGGFDVIAPDFPSGGPLLMAMLNALNATQQTITPIQTVDAMQHVINTQSADGGNPINEPGTWSFPEAVGSHVAAIDSNDLYVSVVSGLNTIFGSELLTDGGFILNSALANFGTGNNAEGPSKRPLSLATPVIAVEAGSKCGRRVVLGAGDFAVAAQTLVQIVSKMNITNSVEAPRFRLTNEKLTFGLESGQETKMNMTTLDGVKALNYKLEDIEKPYQSCNLVEKIGDDLSSHSDSRGQGTALKRHGLSLLSTGEGVTVDVVKIMCEDRTQIT